MTVPLNILPLNMFHVLSPATIESKGVECLSLRDPSTNRTGAFGVCDTQPIILQKFILYCRFLIAWNMSHAL